MAVKKLPALALALMMVLLAACGDGETAAPASPADGQTAADDSTPDAPAEKETISVRIGSGLPRASLFVAIGEDTLAPELARRVEEETDYRLDITLAMGGAVAPPADALEAVQDSLLDIGLLVYPNEPQLLLHNISYWVPFGPPDLETVLTAGRQLFEENPELATHFEEEYGQKVLGLLGFSSYDLNTTFPVDSLDDLQGRKIGGVGTNLRWLEPVNATPVQMVAPEAYTSMQTGVFDGIVMLAEVVYGYQLHEVAPHYTEVGFGSVLGGGVHVNLGFWESLPPEVQQIFEEVVLDYEASLPAAYAEATENALRNMEAEGATITEFPQDQRAEWAAALPNMPQELAEEANGQGWSGTKIVQDYIDIIAGLGYDWPREWEVE